MRTRLLCRDCRRFYDLGEQCRSAMCVRRRIAIEAACPDCGGTGVTFDGEDREVPCVHGAAV